MIRILAAGIILFAMLTPFFQFNEARKNMVKEQIEYRGIKDKTVLDAMNTVPRHLFVTDEMQDQAYEDHPLPIGYGQTISQPYIVAYMTEAIEPKFNHRVLEVGTGSGYQAAVLAEIVQEVYTIEIITELSSTAGERLKKLKYENVFVKNGDGFYGWPEHQPYDAIIVTAAAEYIPPNLIEQLKEGGRMIIPVGSPFLNQNLILVEKVGGKTKTTSLLPVRFVPFKRGK